MAKEILNTWVDKAFWYRLNEYTVVNVAAESIFGWELGLDWVKITKETITACGWSTLAANISITPDEKLDLQKIKRLLADIQKSIYNAPNRVRYTMNGFVISV